MWKRKLWITGAAGICAAVLMAGTVTKTPAKQSSGSVHVNTNDIGGVVSGAKGPEAGVWVIAETKDLPTKFVRIVVTDDRGRYLIPDLPKANYKVWVRGYGLVDSEAVESQPGKTVDLTAKPAPDPRTAAQYYPSDYWYSLLQIPPKGDFPGTGYQGNGISEHVKSQDQWIEMVKTDTCEACHQIGDKATREIPSVLGHFDSSEAAWSRRISSGQIGAQMNAAIQRFGRERALKMYGDWTDRIAAGEYPHEAPPRPQGIERNVVVTEWDWGKPTEYFHDEISTDRTDPKLNANGPVYGVHENSSDFITVLDPVHNSVSQIPVPVRDKDTPYAYPQSVSEASPYWGDEAIWTARATVHSIEMDDQGRLWAAALIRPPDREPAFCKKGSTNPSAEMFPVDHSDRQIISYNPKTQKFMFVDTCAGSLHLQFANDANRRLWFSSGFSGDDVGWINTKMLEETHNDDKSQGWTPIILDTNGNGKRDNYVEPGAPADPTKDTRIHGALYAVDTDPVDGTVWGTILGMPGAIIRLNPGANPPATALAEIYQPPWNNPKAPVEGFSPRGLAIDRKGVIWTVLASGHFASFDRRKCKGPLNGPEATGQQCPEGWTLYPFPGPSFQGTHSGSVDSNYYDWVDRFNTLGLGDNTPIATGNGSDSLIALTPDTHKFVVMRVPYPMGFYSKGLDGRIDSAGEGWKGKGIWSTYATRAPQHIEGGKGTTSKVVHFQLRPNPLAD